MAYESDPHFLVLHALRIKGFAKVDDLAHLTGLEDSDVERQLVPALEQGLVSFLENRGMWRPTEEGKEVAADLLANELSASGMEDEMRSAYPAFLQLNEKFKELCGDWQLFPGHGSDRKPNDHSDPEYDKAIIERLRDLNDHAQGVLTAFSEALDRYSPYGPRLAVAAERVQNGELKQFTGVLCSSYHDIWMELHQDLLLTLAIERSEEGSY